MIVELRVLIAYLTYQSKKSNTTKNDTKESAELKIIFEKGLVIFKG